MTRDSFEWHAWRAPTLWGNPRPREFLFEQDGSFMFHKRENKWEITGWGLVSREHRPWSQETELNCGPDTNGVYLGQIIHKPEFPHHWNRITRLHSLFCGGNEQWLLQSIYDKTTWVLPVSRGSVDGVGGCNSSCCCRRSCCLCSHGYWMSKPWMGLHSPLWKMRGSDGPEDNSVSKMIQHPLK